MPQHTFSFPRQYLGVMISSTFNDLKEHRAALMDAINGLGFHPVAMEHDSARSIDMIESSLQMVRDSAAYVLVISHKYGQVPESKELNPECLSITELEFNEALRQQRVILLFIMDRKHPITIDDIESDDVKCRKLDAFRERSKQMKDSLLNRVYETFYNLDDFNKKIHKALARLYNDIVVEHTSKSQGHNELIHGNSSYTSIKHHLESCLDEGKDTCLKYVNMQCSTEVTENLNFEVMPNFTHDSIKSVISKAIYLVPKSEKVESVEEILNYHRRFMLTGPSGSGKTTTLRYLKTTMARKALDHNGLFIPLAIDLSGWPSHITEFRTLIHFEKECRGISDVSINKLFLFIDEIDCINEDKLKEIRRWIDSDTRTPFIITARENWRGNNQLLELPQVKLAPLNDSRIEQFVRKYTAEKAEGTLDYLYERKKQREYHKNLLTIAGNPYFLACICLLLVCDEKTPALRGELIKRLVDALYKREEKNGNTFSYSSETVIERFNYIAFEMLNSKHSQEIVTYDWFRKKIIDKKLSDNLIHIGTSADYIIYDNESRIIKFKHKFLQEYFAAEYIRQNDIAINNILHEPVINKSIRKKTNFDGTLRLLVDFDNKHYYLSQILKVDPFLSFEFICDLDSNFDSTFKVIIAQEMISFLNVPNNSSKDKAIDVLLQLNDLSTQPLLAFFNSKEHWKRRLALGVLSQIRNIESISCIVSALSDENRWVRKDAERIIGFPDSDMKHLIHLYVNNVLSIECIEEAQLVAKDIYRCLDDDYELKQIFKNKLNVDFTDVGVDEKDEVDADLHCEDSEEYLSEPFNNYVEWNPVTAQIPANYFQQNLQSETQRARKWLWGAPPAHHSWSYAWMILWRENSGDIELRQIGLSWLSKVDINHPGWSYVWLAIFESDHQDNQLQQLGLSWLSEVSSNHQGWSYVWLALHVHFPADEALRSSGRKWLFAVTPKHHGWGIVWLALWGTYRGAPSLLRVGVAWVNRADMTEDLLGAVWRALWEHSPGDAELEELATTWFKSCNLPTNSTLWGYVFPVICKAKSNKTELLSLGYRWFEKAGYEHAAWGYIWPALWESNNGDLLLENFGRTWIKNAAPAHGAWGFIWRPLFRYNSKDKDLFDCGLEWLKHTPKEHPSWGNIWQDIWGTKSKTLEVAQLGLDWLVKAPSNHSAWGFIWKFLWEDKNAVGISNQCLIELGLNWLRSVSTEHGGWSHIYKIVNEVSDSSDIEVLGATWLSGTDFNFHGWSWVWESLWGKSLDRDVLREIGISWLTNVNPADGSWNHIWKHLWEEKPNHHHYISIALDWLNKNPNHKKWNYVWQSLWQAKPNDPIYADLALRWLTCTPSDNLGWTYVWKCLWDSNICLSKITSTALHWLDSNTFDNVGWIYIWNLIWEKIPGDNKLITLGCNYLKYKHIDSEARFNVWKALSNCLGKNTELVSLSIHCLQYGNTSYDYWHIIYKTLNDHGLMPEHVREHLNIPNIPNNINASSKQCILFLPNTDGGAKEIGTILQQTTNPADFLKIVVWLSGDTKHLKQWPFIWKNLYDRIGQDSDLIAVGKEWVLLKNTERHGWALVWCEVVTKEDNSLVKAGLKWMHVEYENRSSWPTVFKTLWNLQSPEARTDLAEIGIAWLNKHGPGKRDASLVWLSLWTADYRQHSLLHWGQNFVSSMDSHSDWFQIKTLLSL